MIPVSAPFLQFGEGQAVFQAIYDGDISGSGGRALEEFERLVAEMAGRKFAVACSSGTTALDLAAELYAVGPGDEILVPACTNIATALAFARRRAIIVPVDSDPWHWGMNVGLVKNLLTHRTLMAVPVHLLGHPVDMDPLLELGRAESFHVLEDAAQAHFSRYRGRPAGSMGGAACFSFYANKTITCGEGGAFVTDDEALAFQARYLRNLAFGQPRFLHQELGFNYRMTNLQAAIGVGQFSGRRDILLAKQRIDESYRERLQGIPGLQFQAREEWADPAMWMFGIRIGEEFPIGRGELMGRLANAGIETRTLFCPMNMQPALLKHGLVRDAPCPVAEDLWRNALYLPSGAGLLEEEIDLVCDEIRRVLS